MKRKLISELEKWKYKTDRSPLILEGARQVGKTYLLKEFGKNYYENTVYVNFDNADTDTMALFAGSIEPQRIIEFLSLKFNTNIIPEKTLIIFDEVQENPRALTSLKYFQENLPQYHLAVAGSLLGVALHQGTSFPVGKVDYLRLEPFDFEEFLWALGKENKTQYLKQNFQDAEIAFNDELRDAFYQYLAVGGMPKAVLEWVTNKNIESVDKILNAIIADYQNDFSKHTDGTTAEKIKYIWQSIPSQFSKENHKFIYGVVKHGARAREYEFAIQWLADAGLVRKIALTTSGDKLPLKAYQELDNFKLYLLDVGLLRSLSKLSASAVISNNNVFSQFNGAFAEQYVLQQIQFNERRDNIYYWTGTFSQEKNGIHIERKLKSEIDFITEMSDNIIPIEVKSGENVKSQSLRTFRDKYAPKLSIRFSLLPQEYNKGLLNIPLYKTFLFDGLAKEYITV